MKIRYSNLFASTVASFLSMSVWASSQDLCQSSGGTDVLKQMSSLKADLDCDEINTKASCTERKIDPEEMRKRITRSLEFFSKPEQIARFQKDWDSQVKYNPGMSKFYAPRSSYKEVRDKEPLVPVLDWLNDPKFAETGIDQEKMKQGFINKFAEYSAKYDCVPTFTASAAWVERHPTVKPVNVERMSSYNKDKIQEKMKAELELPANKKALEDHIRSINEKASDQFYVCRDKPDLDRQGLIPETRVVAKSQKECAGTFRHNFNDNQYEISPANLDKLLASKEGQALANCIKNTKGKIHHVSIRSSASSLNNTGLAAKKFCAKGFEGLSQARAETARDKVLPALFDKAGVDSSKIAVSNSNNFTFDDPDFVRIHAKGENGNGTSGPCVYEKKGDKEVLKPEYATAKGKAALDEHKYIKIHVTFDSSHEKVDGELMVAPAYRCKRISFSCEPLAPVKK